MLALLAPAPSWALDPALEPLPWRNSGAATAGAGLPRALGAALPTAGTTRVDLLVEIASQFTQDTERNEDVVLDAETTTLLLALERAFAPGWSARLELPWVRHGGGILDGAIDDYHDLFGFPDGGRGAASAGNVRLAWRDGTAVPFAVTGARDGIGDIRVGVARALRSGPDRSLAVRIGVELPTGDADALTGSGAADLSIGLHLSERRWLAPWGITTHLSGGLLLSGDDEVTADAARDLAAWGSWTLARPFGERWVLKGQLDGHTATADSALRQIGGWSVQGALGAAWRWSGNLVLEAAFVEDLRPGSAPDISFQLLVRGRL